MIYIKRRRSNEKGCNFLVVFVLVDLYIYFSNTRRDEIIMSYIKIRRRSNEKGCK